MAVKNVKLAQATIDYAAELIAKLRAGADVTASAEDFVRRLHSDAYYARLDGRSARAITLNCLADKVARARNDLRLAA